MNTNKTAKFATLFGATVLMAAAISGFSPARAQNVPSTDNQVFVGGTPILTVRIGAGGMSAQDRATAIQERVNHLLSIGPLYSQDISAVPLPDGEAAVEVKGNLLITADFETARINTSTPMQLATIWADNMRGVLPGLTEPKG